MSGVVKTVRPFVLGVALFALAANDASAQDVPIYGNAKACFGLGCTPTDNALAVYGGFTGTWVTNPLTPDVLFREVALTGNLTSNPNTGALLVNFDGENGVSPWVPFVDVWSNPNQVGELRVTAYTTDIPVDVKNELTGLIELRTVTATPEPASMLLMASGLAGLAAIKRRRKRAN